MTTHKTSQAHAALSETAQDLLLVSSFAFWALLLGLAPVLAIGML